MLAPLYLLRYNENHDMERVCIYTSDVCKITGRNLRSAQKLMKNLRIILKKEKHHFITKQELAKYLGIDPDSFTLQ